MLPIRDLLNPLPTTPSVQDAREQSPRASLLETAQEVKVNAAPRTAVARGNRPHGTVHYSPFENIDDEVLLREIARFRVTPFKGISNSCEHVPYNSAKKDLFEKTGRESIELFRYNFYRPLDGELFTVMWDYHIGLVRLTPFFKCLSYSKTRPSQMLDKNPGLRNICPSITGGSVSAQGYWMPYRCARAICATFCYEIAGALIPLFGPLFPRDCTHPQDPRFGEMRIDPGLIASCTTEAHRTRATQMAFNNNTSPTNDPPSIPNLDSLRQYIRPDALPSSSRNIWRPINQQEPAPSLTLSPRDAAGMYQTRRPLLAERPTTHPLSREATMMASQPHHSYAAGSAAGPSRYDESWSKRRRTPEDYNQDGLNQTEQPGSYRQQKKSRGEDTSSSSTLAGLQQRSQARYPQ